MMADVHSAYVRERHRHARSTDAQTIDAALRSRRPAGDVVVQSRRSIVGCCVSRSLRVSDVVTTRTMVGRTFRADVAF